MTMCIFETHIITLEDRMIYAPEINMVSFGPFSYITGHYYTTKPIVIAPTRGLACVSGHTKDIRSSLRDDCCLSKAQYKEFYLVRLIKFTLP